MLTRKISLSWMQLHLNLYDCYLYFFLFQRIWRVFINSKAIFDIYLTCMLSIHVLVLECNQRDWSITMKCHYIIKYKRHYKNKHLMVSNLYRNQFTVIVYVVNTL